MPRELLFQIAQPVTKEDLKQIIRGLADLGVTASDVMSAAEELIRDTWQMVDCDDCGKRQKLSDMKPRIRTVRTDAHGGTERVTEYVCGVGCEP